MRAARTNGLAFLQWLLGKILQIFRHLVTFERKAPSSCCFGLQSGRVDSVGMEAFVNGAGDLGKVWQRLIYDHDMR